MALTDTDKLAEKETLIRWDETGALAVLWTASVKVRREWEAAGFPVVIHGGGWQSEVPSRMVTYRVLSKSEAKSGAKT